MSNTAIRIEGLSKKYYIGENQKRHTRFGDQLVEMATLPFRRAGRLLRGQAEAASGLDREFWALRDISLEINHGEIVGIIGHNGAGKSTLLKILSRITEPTAGYADLCGRVGSLLEVGTGFHPELTGRENVYLNGSILGMKRAEIARKLDAIIDFAEIEQFIDTPVKHYSSGMYVRLAFSVAAHLEPEILLIDEVLSVGDLTFQKKSLGKMEDVSQAGRTVVFVSHNMNALQRLCPKSILLNHGQLVMQGNTADVIEKYLSSVSSATDGPGQLIDLSDRNREGTGKVRFETITYTGLNPMQAFHPYTNGPLEFEIRLRSDLDRSVASIAVTIYDRYGTKLVNADTLSLGKKIDLHQGENSLRVRIEELHLNPGTYTVGCWAADPQVEVYDHLTSVALMEVVEIEKERIRVQADGLVPVAFQVTQTTASIREPVEVEQR